MVRPLKSTCIRCTPTTAAAADASVADRSAPERGFPRGVKVTVWNAACARAYHKLSLGDAVALVGYRVKV